MPETQYPTSIISRDLGSLPAWANELSKVLDITYSSIEDLAKSYAKPPLIIVNLKTHDEKEINQIREIKKIAPKSQIFVVSQNPETADVILAYDLGANAYFPYPFDLQSLLNKIEPYSPTENGFGVFLRNKWKRFLNNRPSIPNQKDELDNYSDKENKVTVPVVAPKEGYLQVQFFDGFKMKMADGRPINIKGQRIQSILACILFHGTKGIERDRLIQYFWPDVHLDSGRNSLNVAISQLRAALRPHFEGIDLLPLCQNKYIFSTEIILKSDVSSFQALLSRGKMLNAEENNNPIAEAVYRQAIDAYRGDFLPEFEVQEWTSIIRDSLKELNFQSLEWLVSYYLHTEQFRKAIRMGLLLLEMDNCMELAHRQLMYAYYKCGQRAKALKQYGKCKEALFKLLEVGPSKETNELYEIIKNQNFRRLGFPFI